MDRSIFDAFGDVKALIEKDWCAKYHYIDVSRVEGGGDADNPQHEYRWGERAKIEFRKSDVLKFVAKHYERPVTDFKDQYEAIINEEGEDAFADADEEEEEEEPPRNGD